MAGIQGGRRTTQRAPLTMDSTIAELLRVASELQRRPEHRGPVEVDCDFSGNIFTFQISITKLNGDTVPQRRATDH